MISLFLIGFVGCGSDVKVGAVDSDPVNEDTGIGDSDTDTNEDTDSDSDTSGDSDTDTNEPPVLGQCQTALANTNPPYPVFPAWDGRESDSFVVETNGATRTWATVSWGSANSAEGWYISCAEIVSGSTAVIPVEPMDEYGASTFSNTDPADGATVDANGFFWQSTTVVGGHLGEVPYAVTSNDGWNAVLKTQGAPPPTE